jgi:hypothetical protein
MTRSPSAWRTLADVRWLGPSSPGVGIPLTTVRAPGSCPPTAPYTGRSNSWPSLPSPTPAPFNPWIWRVVFLAGDEAAPHLGDGSR